MSLINEALKRARVEAARRDAAAKGVPPAALPIYRPPRRRPWLAPVAGFAAGLAAVGMAAGAFWLGRRPISAEGTQAVLAEAPADAPAARVDAAATPPPASDVPLESQPAPRSPARPAPAETAPVAGRPPRPAAVAPAVPEAPPPAHRPPPPPPAMASPAIPAPSRSSSFGGDAGGRTFLRQAAPAGTSVKVDFIVWSESRPFAQINGQLISSGQSVDGYTLLQVERERVELEGGGERFWIRVK